MIKKYSTFIWIIFLSFLITPYVFSNVITHKIDLGENGSKEIITSEDKFGKNSEIIGGLITVYDLNRKRIGSFSIQGRLYKIEFISLNKDGIRQIAAWSQGAEHFTNLAIYGLKNNKLLKIFKKRSIYGIIASFRADPPEIKVGLVKPSKEGQPDMNGSNWQIWVWNGKKFNK